MLPNSQRLSAPPSNLPTLIYIVPRQFFRVWLCVKMIMVRHGLPEKSAFWQPMVDQDSVLIAEPKRYLA